MLVDDAHLFDDHHPSGAAPARSLSAAATGQKDLSRSGRSLQRLQDISQRPSLLEAEQELHVRAPGPIWKATHPPGPRMSEKARAQLVQRIECAAPEDKLEQLRIAARAPGVSGIAAWRQMREQERAAASS
jgi:hypothetical protein